MTNKWLLVILLVILMVGCPTTPPLTPAERAAREIDRSEKYVQWYKACKAARMQMLVLKRGINSRSRCSPRVQICVPHQSAWDFYYLSEEQVMKQVSSKPNWRVRPGNDHMCGHFQFN